MRYVQTMFLKYEVASSSMWLCNGNTSFLAAVAISFLLTGLVVYYFNIRLRALERTAQKQNQVLASFIGGVQGDLAHGELRAASRPPMCDVSAPGAICSAEGQLGGCHTNPFGSSLPPNQVMDQLIAVSSDEEGNDSDSASSHSSSESSYSDEDSNSDEDNNSDDDAIIEVAEEVLTNDTGLRVIEMQAGDEDTNDVADNSANDASLKTAEVISVVRENNEETGSDDVNGNDDVSETTQTTETEVGENSEIKSVTTATPSTQDIQSMKVAELRIKIVEDGLATASEARGMKKDALMAKLKTDTDAVVAE